MAMKGIWQRFIHYFDAQDLTVGSVKKGILRFLGPTVLSLLLYQIYILVDAMIVGQTLDGNAVAGVNNATNVVYLIVDFAMGCASGFSVVVGELAGKKEEGNLRRATMNQIYLCLFISVFLTVAGILLIDPLLGLIGISSGTGDATQEGVYQAASTYLLIILGGTCTQLFYNHIVGTLRAVGDGFTPFLFLFGSTLLNIGLDCLFIMSFGWGVAGAAWATIIAQGLAAIGCYAYAFIKYPSLRPRKEDFAWDGKLQWASLKNGLPMAFNFSVLAIGVIVMQGAVDRFDVDAAGAAISGLPAELGYGAACKVVNLLMSPLNALGTAMISFHSQNLGAKDEGRVKEGFKTSLLYGLAIYAIVLAIGMLLSINGVYQRFFLSGDKVTAASVDYGNMYLYVALPMFLVLMALFLFRNTLQGLERPFAAFLAGVGELFARVLICLYLPYALNGFQETNSASSMLAFAGACAGDPMAWIVAVLIMAYPCLRAVYGKNNAVRTAISRDKSK